MEGKRALGDTEHDESLNRTIWDMHPETDVDDDRGNGGATNQGGSSSSSGGGAGREVGEPPAEGGAEHVPDEGD